jgi:hypothetical protein
LWQGHLNSDGYSVLRHQGGNLSGHRFVYELEVGPIPEGMVLDHICHAPACVNPNHLRPVTTKQNVENFGGMHANNTSGYRGVSFHKPSGLWHARARHEGRNYSGGYYRTAAAAGEAARALRMALHTHNDLDYAA